MGISFSFAFSFFPPPLRSRNPDIYVFGEAASSCELMADDWMVVCTHRPAEH